MIKRIIAAVVALAVAASMASAKKNKVTQQKAGTEEIASEYWNASDIQHVCEDLINKCATSPRVKMFMDKNGRSPRVQIDPIINDSTERINTQMMMDAFSDAVINSGVLTIIASDEEAAVLRERVAAQQDHASEETAKELDQETAADFVLTGTVNNQVDTDGAGIKWKTYSVKLEMTDYQTHEKLASFRNADVQKKMPAKKIKH